MQPVHAIFGLEKGVIAHLKRIKLLHIRFYLTQKTERQTHLCVGDRRGQSGFLQPTVPLLQIRFTAVDNNDLPDQQHLGGILQMRFIRAMEVL